MERELVKGFEEEEYVIRAVFEGDQHDIGVQKGLETGRPTRQ